MTSNISLWQIVDYDLAFRMILAVILGGLIGIEREWSNHSAGFRTHILVCLGSTTIMLLSMYGFSEFVNEENVRMDPARLAAQVVSGIGFLGAGAIMRNGNIIKGLTTAASLWVVAGIGLCVGAGFIKGAVLCTLLVLISLFLLNKWEKRLLKKRRYQGAELVIADRPGNLLRIVSIFEEQGIEIANLTIVPHKPLDSHTETESLVHVRITTKKPNRYEWLEALELVSAMEAVLSVKTDGEELSYAAKTTPLSLR